MIYVVQKNEVILVTAASTLQEFEEFKLMDHEFEGATVEVADILELMTNPDMKGYRAAPLVITCQDKETADDIINTNMFVLQSVRESRDTHEYMLEHSRLEQELAQPTDRRTLAEIHGLDKHDPWNKQSDEANQALSKQAEQMKKLREAGGITGDSFGGSLGEGVNVHGVNVTVDSDGNIKNASVMATKSTLSSYEITVPKAADLELIFNQLRIPENRVDEQTDTRAVIKLHDFQLKQIATVFENNNVTYTLSKVESEEDTTPNIVEGYDALYLFFSVQVIGETVENMLPLIQAAGIDQMSILATHDIEGVCWFVCGLEADAIKIASIIEAAGHDCRMAAVNRKGRAILGEGANARVVDVNRAVVSDPRPWNDRADEILTMNDEEREKLFKEIKPSEFLFVIRKHPTLRTIVQITPESHFREHGTLWEGEMPILGLVPDKFLTHVSGNTYSCNYDIELAMANMCRFGFVESLLLQLHINELMSIEMAERSQ